MSIEPNSDSQKTSSKQATKASARRPWPIMVAFCFIAAIFGLQLIDFSDLQGGPFVRMLSDKALINIMSVAAGAIALAFTSYWFFARSGFRRSVRMGLAVALIASVAALAICFRVEAIRGDLTPQFRWRWAKAPDRELAPIDSAAGEVDLKKSSSADYSQFLGPDRSLHAFNRALKLDWGNDLPKQKWAKRIGAGWSAFSAVNGYAVTQEQRGDEELITCYDIETGEIRWTNSENARHETLMGYVGPRGTPTIHQGDVYTLGATGILKRVEGATGKTIWKKDLLALQQSDLKQEAESVAWGRSASPLIVRNLVIIPVGGPKSGKKVSLAAFDLATGEQKWTGGESQASYASPILARVANIPMILTVNESSVAGHDPATGKQLWEHAWPGSSTGDANCSQPHVIGANLVLVSKGYGTGSMVIRVSPPAAGKDGYQTEIVWENHRALRTKFTNILVEGDFAFGLSDGLLQCVNVRTGDIEWKAPKRFGNGQILGVDNELLVMSESGEITCLALSAEQYKEIGAFQALDPNSGSCWNNLCLYGNKLLVRNAQEAACWELPAGEPQPDSTGGGSGPGGGGSAPRAPAARL